MRERIPYLDALRCLAIFLVVLLHNDGTVIVNTACYGRPSWYLCMLLDGMVRLGVPLFFMISGCLLLNGTGAAEPAAFYRKKLPRLLVPLAVWNVIYHWTNAGSPNGHGASGAAPEGLQPGDQLFTCGTYMSCWASTSCAPFSSGWWTAVRPVSWRLWRGSSCCPPPCCPCEPDVSWSVAPLDMLMPGQAAYFLLGYGLGRWSLSGQRRIFLYLGGAAGYLVCTAVNLLSASPQEIPLPLRRRGYHLPLSDGLRPVVWVRTLWEKRGEVLRPLAGPSPAIQRAFGSTGPPPGAGPGDQAGGGRPDCSGVSAVRLGLTFGISLAFSQAASRIPILKNCCSEHADRSVDRGGPSC